MLQTVLWASKSGWNEQWSRDVGPCLHRSMEDMLGIVFWAWPRMDVAPQGRWTSRVYSGKMSPLGSRLVSVLPRSQRDLQTG